MDVPVPDLKELWVYLAREPLAALTVTLLAWLAALRLQRLLRLHPLANPVLMAILLLACGLLLTGVQYRDYFQGAQFVHFLLGPATVALAVPLYREWNGLRRALPAVLTAVLLGGMAAAWAGVAVALALHAAPEIVASLAPRSVTTPVAMGIAERIGGLPSLTAAVVLSSGATGAALGPALMNLLRLRDWRARGLAIGTASHGIGTARAISVNAQAGAFAGLGMGLNALLSAILLPVLWKLFM
ncbi:LrgB family protein [Roseomonas sp. NAR14]|uniref:LrgB family protein n=1 Tax=Roseomonas acroporae TaxID=2937791 RepID=A0A9X2BU26_9PROT|nr:LrgB family protein [Roseomonas acroporae]MCK8785263.1 LrgB family protein [Roseomonas acroporae]